MAIFGGGPPNLEGIKYFDLSFCHDHLLTKPNICFEFERNRWFELYHLPPGFLMDTLLSNLQDLLISTWFMKYTYWIRPWRNEEQKVDNKKKRYYARLAVLQALISPWKTDGKKKEKKDYQYTGVSNLVTHPSSNSIEQGLTLLTGGKHVPCGIVTLRRTRFLKLLRCEKASKREKNSKLAEKVENEN